MSSLESPTLNSGASSATAAHSDSVPLPESNPALASFRIQFAEAREKIDYPIGTPLLREAWRTFEQLDPNTQQALRPELERYTEHRTLAETGFGLTDTDLDRRDKILTDGIDLYMKLSPDTQARLKPLMEQATFGRQRELAASLGEDLTVAGTESYWGRQADARFNRPEDLARGIAKLAGIDQGKYSREVYAHAVDRELSQAEHMAFHTGHLHPYASKVPFESSDTNRLLTKASDFAEKGAIDISSETQRIERLHRGPNALGDRLQYLQEFPQYEMMANLAPTMESRYPQIDPGVATRVRAEH